MINGKRVCICGGAGSIGSELCRQLAPYNKIFILDNNESGVFDICQELSKYWVRPRVGDIRDKATIKDLFEDFKPQIVINAAALKHVPLSHIYPRDYFETNIMGNLNLIEEAKRWECLEKYIFISTDKVVSANSIMGITKRCAELTTVNMGKGFIAVRFCNVQGSRGSLFTIWERQKAKGEPITVTDEKMTRYMMSIKDACELVIRAAKEDTGIVVLDPGEPKRIMDLAMQYSNDIKIIGIRKGEVLEEELMFEEEKKRAVKKGKYFLIK